MMLIMGNGLIYALTGAVLFALGLYGLIVHAHLVRKLIAFNIMGSGVFLVLVGLPRRVAGTPPDRVSEALVLTGIVACGERHGLRAGAGATALWI